jgi:hypothetical protein
MCQIRHNLEGHGDVFLLGQWSSAGYWYYFPAALAIKIGLPVFILLALVLVTRPRYLLNGALLASLGLLLLSVTFRVQIGVRFVLPIAVLALVGVAAALGRWWMESQPAWRRLVTGGVAVVLVGWSLLSGWSVWPHGICFTNELFHGTQEGYRALTDSNYDWGQGLKDLAQWQRSHAEAPLNVFYYGADPALGHLPVRPLSLDNFISPSAVAEANRGCFLAVSTNYCIIAPVMTSLQNCQPCARTRTFLIYDFRNRGAGTEARAPGPCGGG